ncbi:hypothetical protein J6590_076787 [Homalodisca vitripennis]|nr:hypothetical protein J6590_076787 [Homalodisca vitripennis]
MNISITDLKKLDLNYQPPADNTSSASVSFLFSTHTRPRVSSKYQAQPGRSPHYLVELFTLGGGQVPRASFLTNYPWIMHPVGTDQSRLAKLELVLRASELTFVALV